MSMFELTEDHLKLTRRMYVGWNDRAYDGAPEIDVKRPYGNSDVIGDVVEILYGAEEHKRMTNNHEDDLPSDVYDRALAIHQEMATVLQIILATQSFKTGKYVRQHLYAAHSWKLIE